jgi:hypothetical protein
MSYDTENGYIENELNSGSNSEDLSTTGLITGAVDLYRMAEESKKDDGSIFDQKRELKDDIERYFSDIASNEDSIEKIASQVVNDSRIGCLDQAIGKIRNLEELETEVN